MSKIVFSFKWELGGGSPEVPRSAGILPKGDLRFAPVARPGASRDGILLSQEAEPSHFRQTYPRVVTNVAMERTDAESFGRSDEARWEEGAWCRVTISENLLGIKTLTLIPLNNPGAPASNHADAPDPLRLGRNVPGSLDPGRSWR